MTVTELAPAYATLPHRPSMRHRSDEPTATPNEDVPVVADDDGEEYLF